MVMRNRDAWLAAIAAALGISEEACKHDAAPQAQAVASASASVAASAPSASADTMPSATASASAAPSASASVAAIKPVPNPLGTVDPMSGLCGASVQNQLNQLTTNGSCGVSTYQPGTIGSGGIGSLNTIGHSNACGAPGHPSPMPTTSSPRAEVTLNVTGGAAGDDHIATNLRPRFRACANQALRSDPSEQGKIVVSVKIAANGEVSSADVASNSGISAASAQCMARMLRNAQFPAGAARTINVAIAQTKQSP
jgi:hypothetical protein